MSPARSMAARSQSLLAFAPQVTKSTRPCTLLHPVLAFRGMRLTSHECFAVATQSVRRDCILDLETLRSSARAEGADTPVSDAPHFKRRCKNSCESSILEVAKRIPRHHAP